MKSERPSDLIKPSLKNVEVDVVLYIGHLEKENIKLHSKIAKLQVANLSITNEKIAVEKELAKLTKYSNKVKIFLPYNGSGQLPTHVQTADGEFIEIFYKHDK